MLCTVSFWSIPLLVVRLALQCPLVVFFVATVTSLAGCLALQVKNVCIWLTYKKDGKKDLTPQLHKQDNPF